MNHAYEALIPITLFICVVYAIKIVLDARFRAKLAATSAPSDLLRSMFDIEEKRRRESSLRFGLVLTCLAIGFAAIELFNLRDSGAGALAAIVGAAGIGNLLAYFVARKLEQR